MHPLKLWMEPQAPRRKATETIQRIPHDGKMMPRGGDFVPFCFLASSYRSKKASNDTQIRHILTVLKANLLVVCPIVRIINVSSFRILQKAHSDVRLDGFARKSRVKSE